MHRFLRNHQLQLLVIALVAVVAFGPFIGHPFLSIDDNYLITKNPAVTHPDWKGIVHVWTHFDPQLYIPLTFMGWQLTSALFGVSAPLFHGINLLLHILNGCLVYAVLLRLRASRGMALSVALLFIVHPLQTEAVLWAAGRKDVQSGFFALLALLQYLRFREGTDSAWAWSILLFGAALLSKVSVALLPCVFLAIDWVEHRDLRSSLAAIWPHTLLSFVLIVVAVIGKSHEIGSSGTLTSVLLPAHSLSFYLQKAFLPTGLSVIYAYVPAPLLWSILPVVCSLAVGLGALFLLLRRRSTAAALPLLLFLVFLAPSFATSWKNGDLYLASDRYAYLAMIGLVWAFCIIGRSVCDRVHERCAALLLGLTTLVLCSMTWRQGEVWQTSLQLYQQALAVSPTSVMAQSNVGSEHLSQKRYAEAKEAFLRAVELDPTATIPHYNLAAIAEAEGDTAEIIRRYEHVVDIVSARELNSASDTERFVWLVGALDRFGRPDAAIRLARKLTEIAPWEPAFWHRLGVELRDRGDRDASLVAFERARSAGSVDPKTYYYLAELYDAQGRADDVKKAIQDALRIDPRDEDARSLLEMLNQAH
jgi:tetratricopeptide (TPR) repeat protein